MGAPNAVAPKEPPKLPVGGPKVPGASAVPVSTKNTPQQVGGTRLSEDNEEKHAAAAAQASRIREVEHAAARRKAEKEAAAAAESARIREEEKAAARCKAEEDAAAAIREEEKVAARRKAEEAAAAAESAR